MRSPSRSCSWLEPTAALAKGRERSRRRVHANLDARPFPVSALHVQSAPPLLDELTSDRQAETRTVRPHAASPIEAFRDPCEVPRIDARASVADGDEHPTVGSAGLDRDLARCIRG